MRANPCPHKVSPEQDFCMIGGFYYRKNVYDVVTRVDGVMPYSL